jgi:oligopeptide/dipeptide ABC transporter ATP-binding protein
MIKPLLEIKNLKVNFRTYYGLANVLDLERLSIYKGETFGLAGESGSGKSITALSIFNLVPCPPGNIEDGEILYGGENLLKKSEREMRQIRGKKLSMIFQDPMSSLNPVFTVGQQITRVILQHEKISKKQAYLRALELFELVKLPDPETTFKKYPHELSGGMRQRVVIAMALSCGAEFLIADEPTRALDVTIQAGVLRLLKELKEKTDLTILLIANSLGVIAQMCERVGLLYAGQIVEVGRVADVFNNPVHPYTSALIEAVPKPSYREKPLAVTKGFPPDPTKMPKGCRFHPRCDKATDRCKAIRPEMIEIEDGHWVSCHHTGKGER